MLALRPLKPKYIKRIYIRSQSADPSPPLGTVLGNLGVNTVSFCTSFNILTKNIPNYFLLKTIIYIYDNKSTNIIIDLPSTGFILSLLKFPKSIKIKIFDRWNEKIIQCVKLYDVFQLAKLKFPELELKASFLLIWGSVKAMNLIVIK